MKHRGATRTRSNTRRLPRGSAWIFHSIKSTNSMRTEFLGPTRRGRDPARLCRCRLRGRLNFQLLLALHAAEDRRSPAAAQIGHVNSRSSRASRVTSGPVFGNVPQQSISPDALAPFWTRGMGFMDRRARSAVGGADRQLASPVADGREDTLAAPQRAASTRLRPFVACASVPE